MIITTAAAAAAAAAAAWIHWEAYKLCKPIQMQLMSTQMTSEDFTASSGLSFADIDLKNKICR